MTQKKTTQVKTRIKMLNQNGIKKNKQTSETCWPGKTLLFNITSVHQDKSLTFQVHKIICFLRGFSEALQY